ncbi:MAG: hypothetical protein GF417_01370 [Candidatus Latescibacteria bacterium]|nr:hypothetical protein [Candidatus Latescibacterota bacterium]
MRILLCLVSVFLFTCSCATGDMSRKGAPATESGEDIAGDKESRQVPVPEERNLETEIYDIEKELPENRELKQEESIEEKIALQKKDSLMVEELEEVPSMEKTHGIGYRVQVFASGELKKAKEVKQSAAEKTSHKVYIEYENGMYKVRIGDFSSREEAALVRQKLRSFYPDSWITETTIRK